MKYSEEDLEKIVEESHKNEERVLEFSEKLMLQKWSILAEKEKVLLGITGEKYEKEEKVKAEGNDKGEEWRQQETYQILMDEIELLREQSSELVEKLEKNEDEIDKLKKEKTLLAEAVKEKEALEKKDTEVFLASPPSINFALTEELLTLKMKLIASEEREKLVESTLTLVNSSKGHGNAQPGGKEIPYWEKLESSTRKEAELAMELKISYEKEAKLAVKLEKLGEEVAKQVALLVDEERKLEGLGKELDLANTMGQEEIELLKKERRSTLESGEKVYEECVGRLGAEERLLFDQAWEAVEKAYKKKGNEKDGKKDEEKGLLKDKRKGVSREMETVEESTKVLEELEEAKMEIENLKDALESALERRDSELEKAKENSNSILHEKHLLGKSLDCSKGETNNGHLVWEYEDRDEVVRLQMKLLGVEERACLEEGGLLANGSAIVSKTFENIADAGGEEGKNVELKFQSVEVRSRANVEVRGEQENVQKYSGNVETFLAESKEKIIQLEKALLEAKKIGKEALIEARAILEMEKEHVRAYQMVKTDEKDVVENLKSMLQEKVVEVEELQKQLNGRSMIATVNNEHRKIVDFYLSEELQLLRMKHVGELERARLTETSLESKNGRDQNVEELQKHVKELEREVLQRHKEVEGSHKEGCVMKKLIAERELKERYLLQQVADLEKKMVEKVESKSSCSLELSTFDRDCFDLREKMALMHLKLLGSEENFFLESVVASDNSFEPPVASGGKNGEDLESKSGTQELMRQIRELEGKVLLKSKGEGAAKETLADVERLVKALEKERGELLGQVEDLQKKLRSQAVTYEGELHTILTKYSIASEELVLSRMKRLGEDERKTLFGEETVVSLLMKEDVRDGERQGSMSVEGINEELKPFQRRISELEGEISVKAQKEKDGKKEWDTMRKLLEAQQIIGRELLVTVASLQQKIESLAHIETVTEKQTVIDPSANSILNEEAVLLRMKRLGEEEQKRLGESIFGRKVEELGGERRNVEELVEALQECVALVHSKDQVITEQVGIIKDLTHMLEVKEHSLDELEQKEEELKEALQRAENKFVKQQEMGGVLSNHRCSKLDPTANSILNEEVILLRMKRLGEEEQKRLGESIFGRKVEELGGERRNVEELVEALQESVILVHSKDQVITERVGIIRGLTHMLEVKEHSLDELDQKEEKLKEALQQAENKLFKQQEMGVLSDQIYSKLDPSANSILNEEVVLLRMKRLGEEEKKRLGESSFDRKVAELGAERRNVEELAEALQECVALVHSKDQVITEQVGIIRDLTHMLEVKEHSLDESEQKEEELEEALQRAENEIFKQQEMGRVLSDQIYSMRKKLMAAEERLRIAEEGAVSKGVILGEQVVEKFEGVEAPKDVNGLEKRESQKHQSSLCIDEELKVSYEKALKEREEAIRKKSILEKEIRLKEAELEKVTEALTVANERGDEMSKEKDVAIKENRELKDIIEMKEAEMKGGTAAGLSVLRKQHKAALQNEREEGKRQMENLQNLYNAKNIELTDALKEIVGLKIALGSKNTSGIGTNEEDNNNNNNNELLSQLESVKEALVKAQTELQDKNQKISELMAEASKQPSPNKRQSAASALLEVTERMKEEANELREESRNAVREKEFFRATAERNEQKAKEAMAKEEQLKADIVALQKTIQVSEKKIDEAVKVKYKEEVNRLMEQQIEAIAAEREKWRAVILELENRVQNLGAYNEELEKKMEVLGLKLQQEMKSKDEKKSAIDELKKELNILTGQNEDLRAQKTWTEGKTKRFEEDLMLMEKNIIEKEGEIRLLEQKVEASVKELDGARREVKRGEERVQQLDVALKEKATLEEKVRRLEGTTKAIEKQLSVVTAEREETSQKAKEDITGIQKTLNGALAELQEVREEKVAIKIELKKYLEVVNTHLKAKELATGEKVKLEAVLQLKQKELDDLRKKNKGTETELRLMGASDGKWAQEASLLREQLEKSVKEREEAKKLIKKAEKAVELSEIKRKEEVGLLQVKLQKEESETKALLKQLENVQKVEEGKCVDLQKLSEVAAQQERQLARMNGELEKLIGERSQLQTEVTREKQRAKQQLEAFTASADAVRRAEVLSARTEVEGRAKRELMEASAKRENAEREVKKVKAELEEVKIAQEKQFLKLKEEAARLVQNGETEKGLRIRERAGYQKKLQTVQNEAGELRKRVEELKEEMSSLRGSFSEKELKEKVARAFADTIPSTGVSIFNSLRTQWFRQKVEKVLGPLPSPNNNTEPIEKSRQPPSPKLELVSEGGEFEKHANVEKHTNLEKHATTAKRKGKKGGKRETGASQLVSPKASASTREKMGGLENKGGQLTPTGMKRQFIMSDKVLLEVGKVTAGGLLMLLIQQLIIFFSSG